jgi:predicted  nucleic acid-binding Zn-ribbon protein
LDAGRSLIQRLNDHDAELRERRRRVEAEEASIRRQQEDLLNEQREWLQQKMNGDDADFIKRLLEQTSYRPPWPRPVAVAPPQPAAPQPAAHS